ncbi:hypothetical protein C900_01265 [Fulvivirga imtechensis AK7]|uniref:Uncharacterized protein n=3 Tax=Fulvivirga TaxID=396811 RepID=L8JKR1_9BACT|nr:hypothetical protein C900_01265 [Fulvivirga imtechensis AK7]
MRNPLSGIAAERFANFNTLGGPMTVQIGNLTINMAGLASGSHMFGFENGMVSNYIPPGSIGDTYAALGMRVSEGPGNTLYGNRAGTTFYQRNSAGQALYAHTDQFLGARASLVQELVASGGATVGEDLSYNNTNHNSTELDLIQLGKNISLYGGIQAGFVIDQSVDIALTHGRGRYTGPLEHARDIRNLKQVSNWTKGISGTLVTVGALASIGEFAYSDKSGEDYARLVGAGVIIGTNFIPYAGPFISTTLGVADATGQFDSFYRGFDNSYYRTGFFNMSFSSGKSLVGPFKY